MHVVSSKLVKSLLIRAARTFLQTFIAVVVASPALNLSLPGLKAAAVAGLASVLSMVNRLLDESPVPSLTDHAPAPEAAPAGPVPAPAGAPASTG
jgi:hypothetical protein